jgi:hypothetical protein
VDWRAFGLVLVMAAVWWLLTLARGCDGSYWELTPKGEHAYEAQEYGLGNAKGTAYLREGRLVIRLNDSEKARYEWHLRGTAGRGRFIGGEGQVYERSSVRFIGK